MAAVLPYPDMDFVPLDILTASELNQMVANTEYLATYCSGLANGSNLDNTSISSGKINWGSIDGSELGWKYLGQAVLTSGQTPTNEVAVSIPTEYRNYKYIAKAQIVAGVSNVPLNISQYNGNSLVYNTGVVLQTSGGTPVGASDSNLPYIAGVTANEYESVLAEGVGMRGPDTEWRTWSSRIVSGGVLIKLCSTRNKSSQNTTRLAISSNGNNIANACIKVWGSNN